jgi:hypothetical protein
MNKGFIAVHRKLLDKSWYHKSNYAHVWLTLLLLATHKKREVWFAGKNIILEPGQLITGRKKLKEITNIPETTLERILDHFEKNEHQIGQQKSNKNRLITIINWSEYQIIGQQNGQQADNKRTTNGQQMDTNNNEDNVDNDDNEREEHVKKIKDYIISLPGLEAAFLTGIQRPNREISELLKIHSIEAILKMLKRYSEYRQTTEGYKFRFAHRWETIIKQTALWNENDFRDLLKRHSGKTENNVPKAGTFDREIKRSEELNRMMADLEKGGNDE